MINIQETIREHPVVIFMKGHPDSPLCGFSSAVVQIFKKLNVPLHGIDVLTDPELRQGIKDFSNWPTLPQVYIKGEFIGGCDIVREMYQTGELQEILKKHGLLS